MGKFSFVLFIFILLVINLSIAFSATPGAKSKQQNYESFVVGAHDRVEEINNELADDEIHALDGFVKEEKEFGKFESISRNGKKYRKGRKIDKKDVAFRYQARAPKMEVDLAEAPRSKFTKE